MAHAETHIPSRRRSRARHVRSPRAHTPASIATLVQAPVASPPARRRSRQGAEEQGGLLRGLLAALGLGRRQGCQT